MVKRQDYKAIFVAIFYILQMTGLMTGSLHLVVQATMEVRLDLDKWAVVHSVCRVLGLRRLVKEA